ncbi:alcohol oxidase [Mytilinidion resinicola]|uniref:Alcohol oxidase n=1 Tax=Mytilinidion resinicola TaxID=574789 RepID=A0A6A6Z3Z2_9PEZI|nr:alcohol oxidase [Mytilinidion resinicola]KAF2815528.1 alcohol oxidase [Mytilinidion resinicola]
MIYSEESFDFVIIGGGTAGANRNLDPKIQVPGSVTQLFRDVEYDWSFNTVPQESLNERAINHPPGKVFGGSSATNAIGWNRDNMTRARLDIDYMDYKLYGKDGPIQTAISNFTMPLTRLLGATLKNLGHKATKDPISGEAVGAYSCPSFIDPRSATRSHAGVAYYDPVKSRPNLHLKENALVEKIVLEKLTDGSVIATESTFGSPALLELSGIGDPALLTSLGIDVVIPNLNVGENLQNHVMTTVTAEVLNPDDSLDSLGDPAKLATAIEAYTTHQTGPLSAGFSATSYLPPTPTPLPRLANPIPPPRHHPPLPDRHPALTQRRRRRDLPRLLPSGTNLISLVPALMHPLSRGTVHITSASPTVYPAINPNYLSHPLDLELFARGLLYCSTVLAPQSLAALLKEGGKGMPERRLATLAEARAYARERAGTMFHPCGTCAMMPREGGAVVGERLVVHGARNLRVVDASVFPVIVKGPVTSSVFAVAERAADLVRGELG